MQSRAFLRAANASCASKRPSGTEKETMACFLQSSCGGQRPWATTRFLNGVGLGWSSGGCCRAWLPSKSIDSGRTAENFGNHQSSMEETFEAQIPTDIAPIGFDTPLTQAQVGTMEYFQSQRPLT